MARRNGRKGDYLASDDYYGTTVYASTLRRDYWGNMVQKPMLRNLQELASPLNDPYPVSFYRGPVYEQTTPCQFEVAPKYVGTTNIPTPPSFAAQVMGWNPTIPNMSVGCTFIVG